MAAYAALAEPHRRQILDLLRERERSVNDLVARLDLRQPGVSKHLKVLRESGLVEVRPEGRQRWYGLRAQPWPRSTSAPALPRVLERPSGCTRTTPGENPE